MKVGDLVTHIPDESDIAGVLRALEDSNEHGQLPSDFKLGVIVEQKEACSRVFSNELKGVFWYHDDELFIVK